MLGTKLFERNYLEENDKLVFETPNGEKISAKELKEMAKKNNPLEVIKELDEKSLTEQGLESMGLSEKELQEMAGRKFNFSNVDSWKETAVLLAKESGEGVEDMLKFLADIPAGAVNLREYLQLHSKAEGNTETAKQAQLQLERLTQEHPSLASLDLLDKEGVELEKLVKRMGQMAVSGKQGDIAKVLPIISGVAVGGVGMAKMGSKFRKIEKIKMPRKERKISDEILETNSKLSDADRLLKAEELLGRKLTSNQQEALLRVHRYEEGHNIAKGKGLMSAEFTKEETKILMDNGVAGMFDRFKKKTKKFDVFKEMPFGEDIRKIADGDVITFKSGEKWTVLSVAEDRVFAMKKGGRKTRAFSKKTDFFEISGIKRKTPEALKSYGLGGEGDKKFVSSIEKARELAKKITELNKQLEMAKNELAVSEKFLRSKKGNTSEKILARVASQRKIIKEIEAQIKSLQQG